MFGAMLCLFAATAPPSHADTPQQRAAALVAQMTSDEKLDLVASGAAGVPRLGIPPLAFIDGSPGVGHGLPNVTSFPANVVLGSTWDPALARTYGATLAGELRAKGQNGLFGPTIEPLRNPLWGRAAETYGEDPFLNSELAVSEVQGLQKNKVIAQIKHFAVNTQEYGRFGVPITQPGTDSQVSRRTLEEIYYPPFKAAIQQGKAASVMCSYIRINGVQACQNPEILGELHGWGLQGFVGPDATFAVRDIAQAADAGVDNFALGSFPPVPPKVVLDGGVSQERIDEMARRIIFAMASTGVLDAGAPVSQDVASTAASRALATKIAAEGTVLLKNAKAKRGDTVLPLGKSTKSIAVIGYDAGPGTQTQEGGSPAVNGADPIAPLDGIKKLSPANTAVSYAQGTSGLVPLPIVPSDVLTPSSGTGDGLSGEFFASNAPTWEGSPASTGVFPTLAFDTTVGATGTQPFSTIPGAGSAKSGRWTGTLTAPTSGRYVFSLTFSGDARLYIGGKRVIAGDTEYVQGAPAGFIGAPDMTFHAVVELKAGQPVPVKVEYATSDSIGGAVLKFGWRTPDSLQQQAVAAARKAEVAVVFANDLTAEGMDRTSLDLPGDQNQLIEAVAKANPNTVVVLHTSSAVLMPWKNRVAGIIEAWYPGQQSGLAIAQTLFGRANPAGKLPVSFPATNDQNPTVSAPMFATGPENVMPFSEGLKVGYRYLDATRKKPLFPFGFGLSYTSFRLSQMKLKRTGQKAQVSVKVKNIGKRKGAQVVQAYLGFPSSAGEPPKQLKAFGKVELNPGQTKTVKLELGPAAFKYFSDTTDKWVRPSGTFRVLVGTSSGNLPFTGKLKFG